LLAAVANTVYGEWRQYNKPRIQKNGQWKFRWEGLQSMA